MQAEMQERNNSTGEEYYDEGMYAEVEESYSNKHPLPDVPEHCAPPSKPLSFILQQAHDWTTQELTGILAPRNPPVPAGEVGKFAFCNRCIYVKLYAVVKWLKSWQKISHLEKISYYLDLHSEQFWEAHEGLHDISEDELPLLGLAHFDLLTAIEVLTTHHYARTPRCIWKRHCKEKLSKNNKLATIQRLGDLLTNALIGDSAKLNAWINHVYIQNGILHLTAENEFFLRMILKDDGEGARWQILTIKSLVNDYVAGIGHDLTHPQHDMEGLAVLVQEKMDEKPKEALETMYNILHTFSLRLQLDILYTRTRQFIYHNPTFAQIKEYDMKKGLLAFYIWPECSQTYLVKVTANRKNRFLKVQHYPHYHNLPDLDIENGNLKCDQFLLETGYHRAAIRIKQIKELLSGVWEPIRYFQKVGDNRIMLMYKIMPYQNTPISENLYITVNVLSGKIQCQVGRLLHQKDGQALVEEFAALLERVLDEKIPFGGIRRLLGKIRLKILKEKYLEGLQGPHTHLLSKDNYMPSVWDITDLPEEKLLFNFHQDNNFYLLVTFEYDQFYDFKVDFYLIERSHHRKHIQELLFNKELWESTVPDLQFVGFKGLLRRPRHLMGKPTTTSWLTKCSQIRSFVAALDSRVQMAKIEEAIKQLGLQSDVQKEEAVGGDVISITDFSKPINFEDAGFQEHIQNVSLRMHRHGIFHMEICIKDHPVETKELKKSEVFRFFAAIHHATIPPNTSYHENLKRHLYDQLTTYGKLYKATRELAAVYELEMKNKINIVFYNYYKLIITYSKDRNLALIASWKINYDQLIANFIQVSTTKDGKVVIADRWNPHVLVSSLLMERLKESDSLPELVNYLVNTERSLSCLYYFSQVHLNSKRATEQIIGIASGPTSINIKNILIPVTEYQIRLVHGSAHIDFYLLNNNKVGIKATQIKSDEEYLKEKGPKLQKLPGFSHFWGQFCMETKLETIVSREVQDYPRDPGNPSSVPPQETADAALDSHPMSCPPKYDERFEEFVKYAEKQERDDLHKVFIIEPDVFEKAMSVPEDKEKPSLSKRNAKTQPMMPPPVSPFEGYLRAVNYIARLPQTLEAFARSQNPLQALPITDLKHDDWSVTFDLQGVHASTVAYPAWTVKFRVFLCPTKFTVSIKMEFSGPSQANDTDIKVFVKYFESVVVPMDNEYALHAFFCMCRINVSGVFSAFARLMAAQMDPSTQLNYYWIVHLQLVNIRRKGPNESSLPDFVSGIVINKSDVLITIGLRPSKKREKDPFKVIKIAFVYNFDTENIRYQPTGPNDENRPKVEAALHNMAMEPSEPCVIWPSIRRLIERFR